MVTVASEVTVPSALRLIPMSPLPTVSGTIDIGAALRPLRPWRSGAACCFLHQTMPATTKSSTRHVATKRHAERDLGGPPKGPSPYCDLVRDGASWGSLMG